MAHNTEMMIHGAMTDVTVLDYPAEWIDYAAAAARWSHRNLLDNAYFANPDAIIDQRGGYVVPPGVMLYADETLTSEKWPAGEYCRAVFVSGTAALLPEYSLYCKRSDCVRGYIGTGYGIDRWICDGVVISENGLTLTDQGKYIIQMLDTELKKALDGKTVTVSALLSTGELLFGTKVYAAAPSANEYFVAGTLHIVNITSGGIMFWANQKATISAAKLELGTVQTLAHQDENGNWVLNDPPPDKGMELLRCIQSTADSGDGYANKVILHTGSKPSGSYTGNGSEAARTIETGGLGSVVLVFSSYGFAILTPSGAIARNGGVVVTSNNSFLNGVITLATTDSNFNANGTTYYYQVL